MTRFINNHRLVLWILCPGMAADNSPVRYHRLSYVALYCVHHNHYNGKTSGRLWTHEDTAYLALTGEIWDVFRELFGERWPRNIQSALKSVPDNKVHVANMGRTWVLPAPCGPHVGPMNLAIRGTMLPRDHIPWPAQYARRSHTSYIICK